MATYEFFDVVIEERIAALRMKRAKRFNALDAAFWSEFPRILESLDAGGPVRAIVLSSSGRHFSAGMDLAMLASLGDGAGSASEASLRAAVQRRVRTLQETFDAIESARVPVIAVVQGGCIGGALDLIAACDLRYASADAFFCLEEINVGMTADLGALQRLPRLVAPGVVRELAYTGRRVPAARAREIGLVNEVFDTHADALAGAMTVAREIAAHSPLAVWGTKRAIHYACDHALRDSLDQVALWQSGMFRPEEVREALLARRQRRAPRFDDLPAMTR